MVTIYVLKCEKEKYYIGTTKRAVSDRVLEHFNNCGSEWTRLYKPIEVIETIENADLFDEDKYTKIYMSRFGIWNVRGGSYTTLMLNTAQKGCIEQELRHCTHSCYLCGSKKHLSFNCTNLLNRDTIPDDY